MRTHDAKVYEFSYDEVREALLHLAGVKDRGEGIATKGFVRLTGGGNQVHGQLVSVELTVHQPRDEVALHTPEEREAAAERSRAESACEGC